MTAALGQMIPIAVALATASSGAEPAPYRYTRPFLQPLPVWHDWAWPWLLVPLCIAVALVYKSIKCRYVRQIPREATVLTVWILLGMGAAAAVLTVVVKVLERG